jgi:hypothetical protein
MRGTTFYRVWKVETWWSGTLSSTWKEFEFEFEIEIEIQISLYDK